MREVTINGSLKKYLVKGKIEDNEKLVVTGNLSCQYYTTELGPPDNHSQPSASQFPTCTAVCKVYAFFYFCLVTPNVFLCPTEVRWFKVDVFTFSWWLHRVLEVGKFFRRTGPGRWHGSCLAVLRSPPEH